MDGDCTFNEIEKNTLESKGLFTNDTLMKVLDALLNGQVKDLAELASHSKTNKLNAGKQLKQVIRLIVIECVILNEAEYLSLKRMATMPKSADSVIQRFNEIGLDTQNGFKPPFIKKQMTLI